MPTKSKAQTCTTPSPLAEFDAMVHELERAKRLARPTYGITKKAVDALRALRGWGEANPEEALRFMTQSSSTSDPSMLRSALMVTPFLAGLETLGLEAPYSIYASWIKDWKERGFDEGQACDAKVVWHDEKLKSIQQRWPLPQYAKHALYEFAQMLHWVWGEDQELDLDDFQQDWDDFYDFDVSGYVDAILAWTPKSNDFRNFDSNIRRRIEDFADMRANLAECALGVSLREEIAEPKTPARQVRI